MPGVTLDLKHWGNSLGIRLPASIARGANLYVGQRVRISVEGNRVVIEPVGLAVMTLSERLAAYHIDCRDGEVIADLQLGEERW